MPSVPRRWTRTATLLLSGAVAVAVVPQAALSSPPGPSVDASRSVSNSLPRGYLLTHERLHTSAALTSARKTELVTYVSRGVANTPIVVSGTVSIPAGKAPAGGWPVLSWAHGTTGTADECAPSADFKDGPAHGYLGRISQTLEQWVRRGYVVVQTDYEGLGTPGGHPYMNGGSAGRTVVDIVRAARRLDARIGRDFVVAGHSQGGHAALFAGGDPVGQRNDVRLKGVIAIAPGGVGLSQTAPYIQGNLPGADAAVSFLPPLLLGAEAAQPSVVAADLLTEKGNRLLNVGRQGCLDAIREAAVDVKAQEVFRPGADLTAMTSYLRSQELPGPRLRVPTMIAQGTADTSVGKPGVDNLVTTLCGAGADLRYRVYDGSDHRGVVEASLVDAVAFAGAVLRGRQVASTCP